MKKILIFVVMVAAVLPAIRPEARAQDESGARFALSTNAVGYVAGGTLNVEGSMAVARRWTAVAAARWNPFVYKQQAYSAGARFWPWHVYSGWWMGAKMQYQEFNMPQGTGLAGPFRRVDDSNAWHEGDRYGMGLSAGYSRMLGRHLNLDLGVGFWGGYNVWTAYACRTCGRIVDTGRGAFVLPSDIIVAISYVF